MEKVRQAKHDDVEPEKRMARASSSGDVAFVKMKSEFEDRERAASEAAKEAGKKEEATEKFKRNSDTSREERKCLCGQEQKRKV